MVNENLQSIGQKLNVSGQDIKNIQKTATKEKLTRFFIPILRVVLLLVLSIFTFIVGISLGGGCTNCAGYPYSAAAGLAITPERKRKRSASIPIVTLIVTLIAALLIPIVTFIAGYLVGRTFFSSAIMYSVYKRN